MEKLFYCTGLLVWMTIALSMVAAAALTLYRWYRDNVMVRFWVSFYLRRRVLPTSRLRDTYRFVSNEKLVYQLLMHRLRNVKRARHGR
jgi:hypothetical protein